MSKESKAAYVKSVYISAEIEKEGTKVDFEVKGHVTLLPVDVEEFYSSVEEFVASNVADGFHRVLVVLEIGFGSDYQPIKDGEVTLILSEVESYTKDK